MKRLRNLLSRIRLVYRRSSTLLKSVVLGTIVLCTVAVVCLSAFTVAQKHRQEELRQEIPVLEAENQELRDRISILGTVESVKQIANEILGLVDKDTVIYDVVTSETE